jgi:hypothetical protein
VNAAPLNLPMGTSPLVLQTIPEPSTLVLALLLVAVYVSRRHRPDTSHPA